MHGKGPGPYRGGMRIAVVHSTDASPDSSGDRFTVKALTAAGHEVFAAVWHDLDVSTADTVLIGAVWDYAHRASEFHRWLLNTAELATLLNPLDVLLWNMRKTYLLELQAANVPVLDMFVLPHWDAGNVVALAGARGWGEIVLKSVVSASGVQMARAKLGQLTTQRKEIAKALGDEAIIVQPYQPEFASYGELSCIFYPDGFSHAVLKKPATGEYRVQAEYGGTVAETQASADALEVAQRALGCAPSGWVYARVDLVYADDSWRVVEVELVEPELFHGFSDQSADRLAAAITAAAGSAENVRPECEG